MVKLYNGVDLDAVRDHIKRRVQPPWFLLHEEASANADLYTYLLDTVPALLVALEVMGDQLELARKAMTDNMTPSALDDGGMCIYCQTLLFKPSDHADDCVLRRVFAIQPDGTPTVPA